MCKSAGKLERIALTAPGDPGRAEERGRDVDQPHLVLSLITLGDPHRLSGGYLYHLRMAAAAPAHEARIRFLSFPEWPFPLAALRGPALLRRTEELRASAVVLDSIAAAFTGPALAMRRLGVPLIAVLHQPPAASTTPLFARGAGPAGSAGAAASGPPDRRKRPPRGAARRSWARGVSDSSRPPGTGRRISTRRSCARPPCGRRAAFLSVANWLPPKGILELLEAFARLPADAGTLHLVGDESADARYTARVRSRLAEGDLIGRVVTHGPLPLKDVAALYAAADVFVLPASRESYGTVWGEAMAFGLPVVGWRAGNLPHLAEDRREGLLAEPGDIGALSHALMQLALDANLRTRLGAAAKPARFRARHGRSRRRSSLRQSGRGRTLSCHTAARLEQLRAKTFSGAAAAGWRIGVDVSVPVDCAIRPSTCSRCAMSRARPAAHQSSARSWILRTTAAWLGDGVEQDHGMSYRVMSTQHRRRRRISDWSSRERQAAARDDPQRRGDEDSNGALRRARPCRGHGVGGKRDAASCRLRPPGVAVFPEGVAFQPETGHFFVSSTSDGSIQRGHVSEPAAGPFIPGTTGQFSAIGLKTDPAGRLYVAGGFTGTARVYNIASRALLGTFTSGSGGFMNDVVVAKNGDVFVTDSFRPILWRIPAESVGSSGRSSRG